MNSSYHISFFICLMILIVVPVTTYGMQSQGPIETSEAIKAHTIHRKLVSNGKCTGRDIQITQSKDTTPGIPEFVVQITNTCTDECAPMEIHLHCGAFASARFVNPAIFKRIAFDDCFVKGGNQLKSGEIIRFTYSNTFMYPLSFKSAKFCP